MVSLGAIVKEQHSFRDIILYFLFQKNQYPTAHDYLSVPLFDQPLAPIPTLCLFPSKFSTPPPTEWFIEESQTSLYEKKIDLQKGIRGSDSLGEFLITQNSLHATQNISLSLPINEKCNLAKCPYIPLVMTDHF